MPTTVPPTAVENTLGAHIKRSLQLGLPLIGAQIAQFAIFTTDVAFVGRLGADPIAGVTLGAQMIFFILILCAGFSIAIIPLAAEARAKGDEVTMRRAVRMGLWQALILSALTMPFLYASEWIFRKLGQPEAAVVIGGEYIGIALWALPFALLINVLRSYFSALEFAATLLWVTIAGVIVNAIADYILVFGNFGLPQLGAIGAAWASVITNFTMFVILAIVAYRLPISRECGIFKRLWQADWKMFGILAALGLPISLSLVAEVELFHAATLMIGAFGVNEQAAHGIVLQITSLAFMVPLGLSQMASIRAGNARGRGDKEALKMVALSSFILTMGFTTVSALAFFLVPQALIGLYLDFDLPEAESVLRFAIPMLFVAAAFQLVDGAQAIAMGILRGIQDIKIPSFMAVFSYWGVGIGTAFLFAFVFDLQGVGVWIGLAAGLATASLLLWPRLWRRHLK